MDEATYVAPWKNGIFLFFGLRVSRQQLAPGREIGWGFSFLGLRELPPESDTWENLFLYVRI